MEFEKHAKERKYMINRVGKFSKVSEKQFKIDMKSTFGEKFSDSQIKDIYEKIELPKRATTGSAGYDIKTPIDIYLEPGQGIKVPTGIRVKIDEGWWLGCFARSGLGFKYRLQIDNGTGIIDSDYHDAKNEGHIFVAITNDSRTGKTVSLFAKDDSKSADAFIQAVFIPFGITYDDSADGTRVGGIGSTNNK